MARSTADVRQHFEDGVISLPMGMENGSPIEGDLDNVQHFYDRGIRYITLTHSLSNHISDSSYDTNRQWNGLSDFGVEVVREMNRLGIMLDISHVSDEAFWQVLDITEVPVIASHSSARHFTPDWERNMDDAMIIALADNGGVIMINFGSSFHRRGRPEVPLGPLECDPGATWRSTRTSYLRRGLGARFKDVVAGRARACAADLD